MTPKKLPNLKAGDRVALSAAFLKNTQAGHDTAKRRGTFVCFEDCKNTIFAIVKWDDQDHCVANKIGDFVEADYRADVAKRGGTYVCAFNIAKVGTAKFADASAS